MAVVSNTELIRVSQKARRLVMEMIYQAGSGHVGGALSCVEILVTLYYRIMKIDPNNPRWYERDRFIMSKGHAGPALYALLAMKGFFSEDELLTLNHNGTKLPSHVDMNRTPGVDMTAGALGQGLSVGVGMAIAARLNRAKHHVFVLVGDGESNEGQIWEAAMAAAKYKLDNLIAIVDYNKLQIDGACSEVMPLEPLTAKWQAFGWKVIESEGHDFGCLDTAFKEALTITCSPTVIIAHTIKGKGVSFAEGEVASHNMRLTKEEYEIAMTELA